MEVLAKSSIEYYKNKVNYYFHLMDNTNDLNKYGLYYEEAIWWLFLYNEALK